MEKTKIEFRQNTLEMGNGKLFEFQPIHKLTKLFMHVLKLSMHWRDIYDVFRGFNYTLMPLFNYS